MKTAGEMVTKKKIFVWNALGNALNVTASVLFLIAVTRLAGRTQSDAFNLGWSVSFLMQTIGSFSVRMFQATDVKEHYSFRQYAVFRFITVAVMGAMSLVYIALNHHSFEETTIILLLCSYKAIDAISDLFQGRFHQKERLDLAGKSMSARTTFSIISFFLILVISHSVIAACVSINLISLACIGLFEIRYLYEYKLQTKEKYQTSISCLSSLGLQSLPLFLNSFFLMFVFNEPKAAIADAMESGVLDTGAQTSYSVLFMPALALNLIILALYPLITKMAILWTAGDTRRYKSLLIRIILSLLIISVVILGIAFLIGIEVLELVFGIKLDGQRPLFMLLLAGGCCNAIMNVFANAITVIRKQYALLFGSASVAFAVLFCSRRLVNGLGLLGAGKVFLSSQMALMIIEAVVCLVLTMKQMKEQKQSMTEPHE